jgi:hypothetical protein
MLTSLSKVHSAVTGLKSHFLLVQIIEYETFILLIDYYNLKEIFVKKKRTIMALYIFEQEISTVHF